MYAKKQCVTAAPLPMYLGLPSSRSTSCLAGRRKRYFQQSDRAVASRRPSIRTLFTFSRSCATPLSHRHVLCVNATFSVLHGWRMLSNLPRRQALASYSTRCVLLNSYFLWDLPPAHPGLIPHVFCQICFLSSLWRMDGQIPLWQMDGWPLCTVRS